MNINEIVLNIYKSVENIKHLKINGICGNFTHFVQIDLNKNILIKSIKYLSFKNIHLIKKKKIIKRVKRFELNNNDNINICNCSSSCICLDKKYKEIIERKIYYSYEIVKIDEINNLNQTEIYGLVFNLI